MNTTKSQLTKSTRPKDSAVSPTSASLARSGDSPHALKALTIYLQSLRMSEEIREELQRHIFEVEKGIDEEAFARRLALRAADATR